MSTIDVQTLEAGVLQANCYLLTPRGQTATVLIDPGGDSDRLLAELARTSRHPVLVLLTHSHYDHIGGVEGILEAHPTAVLACHADCGSRITDPIKNLSAPVLGRGGRVRPPNRTIAHDEVVTAAGIDFHARHLPGHSPGHLVYRVEAAQALFSGDTIFAGGIGRTDLPEGNSQLLLDGLHALLEDLPPETRIYPGHGPRTTVRNERQHNPFL